MKVIYYKTLIYEELFNIHSIDHDLTQRIPKIDTYIFLTNPIEKQIERLALKYRIFCDFFVAEY